MQHEKINKNAEKREFWHNKRILVTGGAGFIGTHLTQSLEIFSPGSITIPRSNLQDLTKKAVAQEVVQGQDIVIHLAARVGGIGYNQTHGAEMLVDNIRMLLNVLEASSRTHVGKVVTLSTACVYPERTPLPFREERLWDEHPEEINAPYALALKMIIPLAQAYQRQGLTIINLIPTNVYGPGDKFDSASSHVIPAIIRKFLEARRDRQPCVEVWGTGNVTREFLFVKDAVEGIIQAAEKYESILPVNLGTGTEITIRDLAEKIKFLLGFEGEIVWDATRPEGQLRRRMDVSRAEREFGFVATTPFDEGLKETVDWYKAQFARVARGATLRKRVTFLPASSLHFYRQTSLEQIRQACQ